jgi:hypothetical protein
MPSQEHLSVEPFQNIYRSESDYSTDFEGPGYYKVDSRLAADIETLTFQIISKLSPLLNKTEQSTVPEPHNFSSKNEKQTFNTFSESTDLHIAENHQTQPEAPELSSNLQYNISQLSQENVETIKYIIQTSPAQERTKIINIIKLIQPSHIDNETIANLFDLTKSDIGK